MTINSFEQAKQLCEGGRSRCGWAKGRKVQNHTYLLDFEDHVTLKYHATHIATFYPDYVKITGAWDSRTTFDRFHEWTPFRIYSADATKRKYLHDPTRVHLDGAPLLGLDYADGIKASYRGEWVTPEDGYETRLSLPKPGTRKAFTAAKREVRKRIGLIVDLRSGAQRLDVNPHRVHRELREAINDLAQGIPLSQDEVVDIAEGCRSLLDWGDVISRHHITDSPLVEARNIDIFEADDLLRQRSPEWND